MIPAPLFSLPMLLLLLAPLLAVGLSLWLALSGLRWWSLHRQTPKAQRPRFWRTGTIAVAVLALAGDIWGLFLLYQERQMDQEYALKTHYRNSRQQFVLPQDFQYGELLVPKGSLINLYNPFDNGEPQRPLGLGGLQAVRFAHPVQVAGVWATAMAAHPAQLELAQDQRIAPVAHFDASAKNGYGAWVRDPHRAYLDCQKGTSAWFDAPSIDYDIQAEFGHPPPDGPQARFRPSQWTVMRCDSNASPVEVLPTYAKPAPAGAQTQVWGPPQP